MTEGPGRKDRIAVREGADLDFSFATLSGTVRYHFPGTPREQFVNRVWGGLRGGGMRVSCGESFLEVESEAADPYEPFRKGSFAGATNHGAITVSRPRFGFLLKTRTIHVRDGQGDLLWKIQPRRRHKSDWFRPGVPNPIATTGHLWMLSLTSLTSDEVCLIVGLTSLGVPRNSFVMATTFV